METTKDIFTFKEDGHEYTLNGKKLTGVTTILNVLDKPFLVQWSANMAVEFISKKWMPDLTYSLDEINSTLEEAKTAHRRIKEQAGDKGKDLHSVIETLVQTAITASGGYISPTWRVAIDMLVETEQKRTQLLHFLDWAKDKKFLESEKRIYSKTHWLGGTVDFVYEFNGEVHVGDIKTGKMISPSQFWQTSAYQLMLQEMGLYPKIKGFTIVRLGKDGGFEIGENFSYEDNIEGFLSALTIYRKLHAITPKKRVYKTKK